MISRPFCLTLLACALSATLALAHEGATGVVKERQDLMDSQKDAMKVIGDMAKGKTPFDAAAAIKAANDIHTPLRRFTISSPRGAAGRRTRAMRCPRCGRSGTASPPTPTTSRPRRTRSPRRLATARARGGSPHSRKSAKHASPATRIFAPRRRKNISSPLSISARALTAHGIVRATGGMAT